MGFADLHIHTVYSRDAAESARLDIVAITDHDCIDGALEAQELAPAYGSR